MTILVWHTDGTCQKFDFEHVTVQNDWGTLTVKESSWADIHDVNENIEKIAKIEIIP